jgi:outer membrane protein assembly factor BamB
MNRPIAHSSIRRTVSGEVCLAMIRSDLQLPNMTAGRPCPSVARSMVSLPVFGRGVFLLDVYLIWCGTGFSHLQAAPGDIKWQSQFGDFLANPPAIGVDNTIYVGSWNAYKVYALDGASGQKKWDYATGGQVVSAPAIGADNTVYFGSYDRKVYALDGTTGQKK